MTTDDLKAAIDRGDVTAVRAILADDPGIVTRQIAWGCDASEPISYVSLARFHGLAEHGRMGEIARILLAAGAPVEGATGSEETPIVTAASYDEAEVAAALIKAGADLDGRGFAAPGGTALAHAVYFGNRAVADVLMGAGARVGSLAEAAGAGELGEWLTDDRSNEERALALRNASVCERLDVIDQLLDAGVDIHAEADGATVLHWAAWSGKISAVRHLVERGADAQRRDPAHGGNPLGWCRHRHNELFRPSLGHEAVEDFLEQLEPHEKRS